MRMTDISKAFALILLVCGLCASCDDNGIGNDLAGQGKGTHSTSFSLNGLNAGILVRSGNEQDIPFGEYAVRLFVFKGQPGKELGDFRLDREPLSINTSLVTVENIASEFNYFYVFLACKKEFLDNDPSNDIDGKDPWMGMKTGMTEPKTPSVGEAGTPPGHCYLPVFNEPPIVGFDDYTVSFSANLQAKTNTDSNEDYMIYGWAKEIPGDISINNVYTPQDVIFAPQLGAIEFDPSGVGAIQSCSVYSNFYRFYLSQMFDKGATTINTIPEDGYLGAPNDLQGNYYIPVNIDKTFSSDVNGTGRYVIYVPCTTLRSTEDEGIQEFEMANTYAGTFCDGMVDVKTSVGINGKTYSTSQPFPVFPKTVTQLRVNDRSLMVVGFKSESGGSGVDLEDDEWDGIKLNNNQ